MTNCTVKPAEMKRIMYRIGATVLAMLAFASLVLAGCGGNSPTISSSGAAINAAGPDSPGETANADVAQIAEVKLPESQGKPGVDYSTSIIEVLYRPQAVKAARALGVLTPEPESLVQRPNPVLRENRQFEPLSKSIADRYGISIRHEVYISGFNWAAFDIPAGLNGDEVLGAIARDYSGVVESAGYTGIARAGFVPDDPDFVNSTVGSGPQWGQRRVGCATAWDTTLGDESLLIGVVDTGVFLGHEELVGQVLDPEVAFPGQQLDIANQDNTMEDGDGHGTAVCGVIAAMTNNGHTVAGIASGCRVIPVKIANTGDFADYADMIAGVVLAAQLGARVINMSWYGSAASISFREALIALEAQGVLVVVCAGNKGQDQSAYPAAYDQCMSVGATDKFDSRATFSNWGEDVDIAAPGEDLKVLTHAGTYREWWGTSFSTPMAASGAALLWSAAPQLSLRNVRDILESTGPAANGFLPEASVHRLALGQALASIPGVQAAPIGQLIMRDQAVFAPLVSGDVQEVELYVDNDLAGVSAGEPWTFEVDLSGFGFEAVELEFRAQGTYTAVSDSTTILVDGSDSVYDLHAGFEDPPYPAIGYDARQLDPAVLAELKQMSSSLWTPADLAAGGNGPAFWRSTTSGQAGKGLRYANFAMDYGAFETDVLVTRRIDLSHARSAQLGFYTKHNIESSGSDRGWVLVTADEGLTFFPLSTAESQAFYTGYAPDYYQQTIDLNEWLGQQVRIVFLFESDASGAGDQEGELAAWWLDEIDISGEWFALGGVGASADGVAGAVDGVTSINVELIDPIFADRVDYWLDLAPFEQLDDYDLTLTAESAPFNTSLNITSALAQPNQLAVLRATALAADGYQGETVSTGFYLFNRLGDVNADGVVDETDTAAYAGLLGLTSQDPGYIPLFDSDLDGVITESDAGAVGYYFGS